MLLEVISASYPSQGLVREFVDQISLRVNVSHLEGAPIADRDPSENNFELSFYLAHNRTEKVGNESHPQHLWNKLDVNMTTSIELGNSIDNGEHWDMLMNISMTIPMIHCLDTKLFCVILSATNFHVELEPDNNRICLDIGELIICQPGEKLYAIFKRTIHLICSIWKIIVDNLFGGTGIFPWDIVNTIAADYAWSPCVAR